MTVKRHDVHYLALCSLFVALIAVGAFIKIPVPNLPITLQTLFTMLAGMLLGSKRGAMCCLVYVIMGLVGIPVFVSGGGLGYIFKPTFGYLLGFILGAFITGYITEQKEKPSLKRLLAAGFAGLGAIYFCGMIYYFIIMNFYLKEPFGIWELFLYCFLMTISGDIILCVVGSLVAKKLIPVLRLKH